jgi:hypothetical protein
MGAVQPGEKPAAAGDKNADNQLNNTHNHVDLLERRPANPAPRFPEGCSCASFPASCGKA